MTVVNPKSISGINSITMASGGDDLLTIHSNNTTERVRVNNSGDVIVGSGVTLSPDGDIFATGVTTSTTFVGALTGNVTGNQSGGTVSATSAAVADLTSGRVVLAGTSGELQDDSNLSFGSNTLTVHEASLKGNQLLFGASGTAYIDHSTTGQDIQFRTSVSSSQDTTGPTIKSTGNIAFASGKGIDFSATSDASGQSSELLDDYEEGTWTPVIKNSGQTSNFTGVSGKYTKIGNIVTATFNADGGSTPRSGGSGTELQMTGLPFNQSTVSNPILGIMGGNDNAGGSSGLYGTAGVILNIFGQSGTQVRFGIGGQPSNIAVNYASGTLTYHTS